MAYKKYIKKDGKLYGPYIYESKRVDGKVVSEYHGSRKTINMKRYAWIFASAVLALFLVYFLSTFNFGLLTGTGQAILNTEVNYTENEPIQGNIAISLKQGELLPADSKLILKNDGQSYEYNLNKIVSNQVVYGNFYIEGISLSGEGEGYGIEGEKQVYPPVSFILNVYPSDGNADSSPEQPANDVVNNGSDVVAEPVITETIVPDITDTTPTIITEEPVVAELGITETPVDTTPTAETSETVTETSPITGFFVRVFNFILGLTPTGNVVSEGNEINGETSVENPFVHSISEGDGVQLKEGSVSVQGSPISDENVELIVNGSEVNVETSYSVVEKGYGKEYLGESTETININLADLKLVLNNGDLNIKITHGNDEIFSTIIVLEPGQVASVVENVSNSTTINVTVEIVNDSLIDVPTTPRIGGTVQVINSETVKFILTENEKALLEEEFGEIVVQTTKSEIINDNLIKRYEIGKYWIEYSYNVGLSDGEIDYQSSIDRMRWLKDIAQQIEDKKIRSEASSQPIENFSVQ